MLNNVKSRFFSGKRIIFLILAMFMALSLWSTDKNHHICMIIPNPFAPSNAVPINSELNNDAFNAIANYLLDQKIAVIDKNYVDQAIAEAIKNKENNFDFDKFSIQFSKRLDADRLVWFYLIDKSGNFMEKHFECTLKLINVETGELLALKTATGISRGDKSEAVKNAALNAIKSVGDKFQELITLNLHGKLTSDKLILITDILNNIPDVEQVHERAIDTKENIYSYTLKYNHSTATLLKTVKPVFEENNLFVELTGMSTNSLSFNVSSRYDRYNVKFYGKIPFSDIRDFSDALNSIKDVTQVETIEQKPDYFYCKIFYKKEDPSQLRDQIIAKLLKVGFKAKIKLFKENKIEYDIVKIVKTLPSYPLYITGFTALGTMAYTGYTLTSAYFDYDKYYKADNIADMKSYKQSWLDNLNKSIIPGSVFVGSTAIYFIYHHAFKKSVEANKFQTSIYFKNNNPGLCFNYKF